MTRDEYDGAYDLLVTQAVLDEAQSLAHQLCDVLNGHDNITGMIALGITAGAGLRDAPNQTTCEFIGRLIQACINQQMNAGGTDQSHSGVEVAVPPSARR